MCENQPYFVKVSAELKYNSVMGRVHEKQRKKMWVMSEDSGLLGRVKRFGMVYGLVIRVRFQHQFLRLFDRAGNLAPGRCSNFFALSSNVSTVSLDRKLFCLFHPYPCKIAALGTEATLESSDLVLFS